MPASKRWNALKKEVEKFRRQFLPATFSPTGAYPGSARVQAHTRAFVVLCHAEVESYLEAWAKEIARKAEDAWTSNVSISEPLTFLVATHGKSVVVSDNINDPSADDVRKRFGEIAQKRLHDFYKLVADNNGIKEHNVAKLFAPLGVPSTAYGANLLTKLESLGARRGTHAHNSSKLAAVINVLDPKTEYDSMMDLVNELEPLDLWFGQYKKKIR